MNQHQQHVLFQMADRVEYEVKDEEFDMDRWCGTACCAVGNSFDLLEPLGIVVRKDRRRGIDRPVLSGHEGNEEFQALGIALGISTNSSCRLFDPCRYYDDVPTRETVAHRIRNFAKEKQVEF